ncbi:MAG TPA: lipoyl synthase [candidate division Zixibacteria bacterium]|nr:lipoyl synthase [candidate division Zixibacteria bacterium]
MISKKQRKPDWLKIKAVGGEKFKEVNQLIKEYGVQTVCQAANCPNRAECFERGTATFLILGPKCTRNCSFCDIDAGLPNPVDSTEPKRVAEMSAKLKLKHIVITSVTRDDLSDGGAVHFAETVKEIRSLLPHAAIELLTPDFLHAPNAISIIIDCKPNIFNHNLETVQSLYPIVRPQANYQTSLNLLKHVSENSEIRTKSGIMVGVGETKEQLKILFDDLYAHNVSILTIGQYLAPSSRHLSVKKYYHPDEFSELKRIAENAGIAKVVSAPLVRSSYRADQI